MINAAVGAAILANGCPVSTLRIAAMPPNRQRTIAKYTSSQSTLK